MQCIVLLVGYFMAVLATLPPASPPRDSLVQRYEALGAELFGADPFVGTPFCGPRLSVSTREDVRIIMLPNATPEDKDLRLIALFPNIEEIRSRRALSVAKRDLLRRRLGDSVELRFNVRDSDGNIAQFASNRLRQTVQSEKVDLPADSP